MKQIETERKLVILKPTEELLRSQKDYTKSEITQIYLEDDKLTHRIRKRAFDDRIEYTENRKQRISPLSVIECEEPITEAEFDTLSGQIQKGTSPLAKTRITFSYKGHTIELDFYPEWERTCILEVELESESEELSLPDFIKVIREVSGNKTYSNHSMARKFPEELV